jgi:hypothetical protein
MVSAVQLERKIGELLDEFYQQRLMKINKLNLKEILGRKNPYLFRALGVQSASEIVHSILSAFSSSSDETIFGNIFFEPLAAFVPGGAASPSEGVDIAIETANQYKAIAVKSGTVVFNAQSRKKQIDNFKSLEARLRKLRKHFDPIVGYCYGRKKSRHADNFRELAGQEFWQELTGDPEFYKKIIALMKDKPQQNLRKYKEAYDAALNRFVRDFILDFCNPEGSIDWDKLVQFNSGKSDAVEKNPKAK